MRTERLAITDGFGREETAAQNFGDIFSRHRLDEFNVSSEVPAGSASSAILSLLISYRPLNNN